MLYWESMCLGIEYIVFERERIIFRKYHEQILKALTDEEGLHLVDAL